MSTTLLDEDGLRVTRYCGPETRDGSSRLRFEIARDTGPSVGEVESISVSLAQMDAFVQWALRNHLGVSRLADALARVPGS